MGGGNRRIAAVTTTSEAVPERHEVEDDDDDCSKSLVEEEPIQESHSDVVTTFEFPHDDVEDEEDDKNAKTGETPIYTVSLKTCVSPFNCTCLGKFIKPIYSQLLVVYSLAILATIALHLQYKRSCALLLI